MRILSWELMFPSDAIISPSFSPRLLLPLVEGPWLSPRIFLVTDETWRCRRLTCLGEGGRRPSLSAAESSLVLSLLTPLLSSSLSWRRSRLAWGWAGARSFLVRVLVDFSSLLLNWAR